MTQSSEPRSPAGLEHVVSAIAAARPVAPIGRVTTVNGRRIVVSGLQDHGRTGDCVEISAAAGSVVGGEVIATSADGLTVLGEGELGGLAIGDVVTLLGPAMAAPDPAWIGRVIDPLGNPIDGMPLMQGLAPVPLASDPPRAVERRGFGRRLDTGLAVLNTFLPVARGQRVGLFAGSGVGKSTLLAMLAQGVEADIVVIALVGERGREVRDFVNNVLGPEGMSRSVIVAATSDRSPLLRRRCALTAMTVAEHFRDAGLHVLLLVDSITRFAEAHREVAIVGGEGAELRGFPPSVAHVIPALCERAGSGTAETGDITAVFTVLVAGSDMEEPIADIMRGVLDGHIVLDRDIAERGRFPAIDVLRSVSRSVQAVVSDEENATLAHARKLLGAYEKAELMIRAGLYEPGSDPDIDDAISAHPRLESFMARHEYDGVAESFDALKACLPAPAVADPDEDTHPDDAVRA